MRKLNEVESSQTSRTTDRVGRQMQLPPRSQSLRDTETTFGSSIATSVFDEVQKDVDQFIASGYRWQSQSHDVYTISDDDEGDDDVVMVDPPVDSPKRQKLSASSRRQAFQLETVPASNPARFYPSTAFAQLQIPEPLSGLPFHVQWEAQRLLQAGIVKFQDLDENWSPPTIEQL